MITTKQRAYLRSLVINLDPVMQIGKDGVKEQSIAQIENLLETRELFKIKVLNNCESSPKDIAQKISDITKCEIVQVIGSKISIFRVSKKKDIKHIKLI